jgi:Tol biopolymer transport system component
MTKSPFLVFICLFLGFLTGCNLNSPTVSTGTLNSRYNDEKPALSGDGRWIAFVSNRRGSNQILLYDLQTKQYEALSGLYTGQEITDSPSLSQTGRYLAYVVIIEGRPVIALYDRIIARSELLSQNYRGWLRNPRISPDGRYLVFESARRGQWDVEVLDRGPNIELDLPDGSPVENPQP